MPAVFNLSRKHPSGPDFVPPTNGCHRRDGTCQNKAWCESTQKCGWAEFEDGRSITPPDPLCIELCIALNSLPGIQTDGSCQGHGLQPFRVWLRVTDFSQRGLVTLARLLSPRYYDFGWRWKLTLDHGDSPESQVSFVLEGPSDSPEAVGLAAHIRAHLEGRTGGYNILTNSSDPVDTTT